MQRSRAPLWALAVAAICATLAVAFAAIAIGRCTVLDALRYYPTGVCERAPSVRYVFLLAVLGAVGALATGTGAILFAGPIADAFRRAALDVRGALSRAACAAREEPRRHWIAVASLIVIGTAVRLALLRQPIRYDEAYTQREYLNGSLVAALSDYTHPNNHLLHTVLARLSTALLGEEPWALRIPALVAGILVIPATYVAGRALAGRTAAIVGAALVAASSEMILYSTNARGYTMVVVATLCLIVLAEWWRRDAKPVAVVLAAVAAGLGAIAVPVIVYPIVATVLWLALAMSHGERHATPRQALISLVVFCGLTGLISALGYSLVVLHMGWRSLLIGRDLWSVDDWRDTPRAIGEFLANLGRDWTTGIPAAVAVALLALLVVGVLPRAAAHRARWGFPIVLFATSLVLLVMLRAIPPTRGWLFALPFAAIAVGEGVARLTAFRAATLPPSRLPEWTAVVLAVALALNVVRSRSVLDSDATGTLQDGEALVRWMAPRLEPAARVVSFPPTDALIAWHFERLKLPADRLAEPTDDTPHLFAVVNERHGQTIDTVLDARRVDRSRFGPPRLLRRFTGASVYDLRLRLPAADDGSKTR